MSVEEYKISEVFKHEEAWLQCVEKQGCLDCFFNKGGQCLADNMLDCSFTRRSDKKSVIFKELPKELPVGFEFIYQGRRLRVEEHDGCAGCVYDNGSQCLKPGKYTFFPCERVCRKDDTPTIFRDITDENKENKKVKTIKFKYMEPERKKLTIPEGWEFDKLENGEIILKTTDPVLPATLNDCCLELEEMEALLEDGGVELRLYTGDYRPVNGILIPEGMGKPILALCQLLICRNAWWKVLDWKPDWKDREAAKFVIEGYGNSVRCNAYGKMRRILAFPTLKTRDKFMETFKDLIEEAKELL